MDSDTPTADMVADGMADELGDILEDPELIEHRHLAESAAKDCAALALVIESGTLGDIDPEDYPEETRALVDSGFGELVDPEHDSMCDSVIDEALPCDCGQPDAVAVQWEDPDTDWVDVLNTMALEVYASARLYPGHNPEDDIESVTIVWGTGGPHYESTIDSNGRTVSTAYGWFEGHRVDVVTRGNGSIFELIAELVTGSM